MPTLGQRSTSPASAGSNLNPPPRSPRSNAPNQISLYQKMLLGKSPWQGLAIFRLEKLLIWTSPLLVVLIIALIYFVFIERWLYLRLEPAIAIHRIYQNFYRSGKKLTGDISRAETSSEYLERMIQKMNETEIRIRFKKPIAQARINAQALTKIYLIAHCSWTIIHKKEDVISAWRLWISLRYQLFVAKLFSTNNKHPHI